MDNVRIIDNSEIGMFLADSSKDAPYKKLLESAIANDIKNGTFDLSAVENGLREDQLPRLNSLLSKSSLTNDELNQAVIIASSGFNYEPTKGAWAIASEQFIKTTPPTSEIICVTAEANLARTWGLLKCLQA